MIVLYLGVVQIGLAYTLFTLGMARGVRSLDAGVVGYIEPMLNPVWVFIFLGERPSNWAISGRDNHHRRRACSHTYTRAPGEEKH